MPAIPRFIAPMTATESIKALASCVLNRSANKDAWSRFAEEFAAYIGVRHAIPTPSARLAFSAVLSGLDLPQGGEVVLPSLIFHGLPVALSRFGLTPRFADIDPQTYCVSPERIEEAITEKTVALVVVHQYGRACDMEAIKSLAAARNLPIIEDCAQACGASSGDHKVGSIGSAGIFSFGPTKNLSTLWAGMVTTNDSVVAAVAKTRMASLKQIDHLALARRLTSAWLMRSATNGLVWNALAAPALNWAGARGYDPVAWLTDETPPTDGRTDPEAELRPRPLQAVIGLGQLAKLEEANRKRMTWGDRLTDKLSGAPGITVASKAPTGENIYMSFVARVMNREQFRRQMQKQGIDTHAGNMFAGPDLPGMADTGRADVARHLIRDMVHLPVYPELSEQKVDRIAEAAINAALPSPSFPRRRESREVDF